MNAKTQYSKLGIINLVVLSVMGIFALVLPIATELVQENQENRSQAAVGTTCATLTDRGKRQCRFSGAESGLCMVTLWKATDLEVINDDAVVGEVKRAYWNWVKCPSGKKCNSKTGMCETIPTPTSKPKTCSYGGNTYAIGRAICQGKVPAECLATGNWKTFSSCTYGCSGNGVCNPEPTLIKIDGQCSATLNKCIKGTLKDLPDSTNSYNWVCLGKNSGSQDICSLAKPTPTSKPKTCSYGGNTYVIGRAICQGKVPAECLSTGNWKTFSSCPHGCSGNGVCNPKPTLNQKPSCKDKGGICVHNLFTCGDKYSGKTILGTDCGSVCCDKTIPPTKTPTKIISCTSQKGICQPLGECRADNGKSLGKLDCTGTDVCCQETVPNKIETTCIYNKINYSVGKYLCQGNNTAQGLCSENGKWNVKVCPYLCNLKTGMCNPNEPCQPFQYKCSGRNLMMCKSDGLDWEIKQECGIDQTCNVINKACVSRTESCNPKEDNNQDGVINSIDAFLCSGMDGTCNPDYYLKTLKVVPPDSKACQKGSVVWINKEGTNGKFEWNCLSLSNGLTANCSANKEKGSFGSECQNDNDCQVNGLSRCVENHCMIPGGCISTKIDKRGIKWWQGSICLSKTNSKSNKDQQYVCNNTNNSSNQDFWNFDATDCSLGCDRNGIKCLANGWKCSEGKNVVGGLIDWWSEYYQDNKKIDSLKCEFGCDQTSGRCNVDQKSTSKNPICDAIGGICFGNVKTCQEEGGVVINKTDCVTPQVCCKMTEEKKGCINPQTNRKYSEGSSICASGFDFDTTGLGTNMIKCQNGALTSIFCEFGCENGFCLKGNNQTCKFNFQCQSKNCGSGGMCLLKPEGGTCQSNSECQSNNCPIGICLKNGVKCDIKWKKNIDWYFGCDKGQSCTQGQCVTDGICGLANKKDGRTFSSPPTTADNLCKSGKPTIVKTEISGYNWQCLGDGYLSKNDNCSAKKGEVNCGGLSENSKICGNFETILTCTKDGWVQKPCDLEIKNGEFCFLDKCIIRSDPKKEGDFCKENSGLRCPAPLVCDSNSNTCTTKDKISSLSKCKSSGNYKGREIYNENSCVSGYSCDRKTLTCRQIISGSIKNYLKAGEFCTSDIQCVSGYCTPNLIFPENPSVCNDYDQKTVIDLENKEAAIIMAVASSPFVIAAAPAVITKLGVAAMTQLGTLATTHPLLAQFLSVADTTWDVGEIVYGLAMCAENPNSEPCLQAQALASNSTYMTMVIDQAADLARGVGAMVGIGKKATTEVGELLTESAVDVAKLSDDIAEELGGDVSPNILEQTAKYSVDISKTPRVPGSTIIDQEKLQAYLNSITDSDRRAAVEILANGVMQQHITHNEFVDALNNITVPSVNRIIGEDQYLAIVESNKSNKWVLELSLPNLAHMPSEIISQELDAAVTKDAINYLKNNPLVKKVVMFDDASYSGTQLLYYSTNFQLKAINNGINDLNIIIAAPYITTVAQSRLLSIRGVKLADHNIIPVASQVFTPGELSILSKITRDFDTRTVTTFDHKIADGLSTLDLQNYLVSKGGFIPNEISPYKVPY